ncbi:hypothetical protein [Methanofollis sp. W23]|uniref:hypothetical protein n=1 Tax=Methanofollis sp. W23 TaxID=2817849 RepID=UPI001AE50E7A|nr:hypothetical protein [Methanofollis sp. W23]
MNCCVVFLFWTFVVESENELLSLSENHRNETQNSVAVYRWVRIAALALLLFFALQYLIRIL